MKKRTAAFVCAIAFISLMSGCASYRTSSNIRTEVPAERANKEVLITEGDLTDRSYEELQWIDVTVKKLTAFHKDPTPEQANEALIEKARAIDADAVINVTYKSGLGGWTTWGYIDAKGLGVKFTD